MKKTIMITGASSGIGRTCAEHFDKKGYNVIAAVRKPEDAKALLQNASDKMSVVLMDLQDHESIKKAAHQIQSIVGRAGVQGLVNNAGIVVPGPIEFLDPAELKKQLDINVVGQVAVTQQLLPLLRAGKGRIVNIGSISGRMATPFVGPYAASKFALEAITDSLRMELAQWNIPVSIIEPGSITTPIWDKTIHTAQRMVDGLSNVARRLYGGMLQKVQELAANRGDKGTPPEVIALTVEHALEAKRPRIRYLVGLDAKFRVLLKSILPTRWLDRLIVNQIRPKIETKRSAQSGWKAAAVVAMLMLASLAAFAGNNYLQQGDQWFARRAENANGKIAASAPIDKAIFYYEKAVANGQGDLNASIGLLRSLYFKATFTQISKQDRKELYARGKLFGEKKIKKYPRSAALNYWLAVHLGKWAQLNGVLAAAREGIASRIRDLSTQVTKLDPGYNHSGGYTVLGLAHFYTPRIPFLIKWPSNEKAMSYIDKALRTHPNDLSNRMCKAQVLADSGKKAEARVHLNRVIKAKPRANKYIEDLNTKAKARALLKEIS